MATPAAGACPLPRSPIEWIEFARRQVMADIDFENAQTLEAPSPLRNGARVTLKHQPSDSGGGSASGGTGSGGRLREAARGMIAFVEGSAPHLSTETREVLQERLKTVAWIFFGGFLAFQLRWLLIWEPDDSHWLFWVHLSVTAFLGAVAAWLTWSPKLSAGRLRIAEAIVFGDPALYFIILSQQKLHLAANLPEGPHLPSIVAPWMLLIFTYALFIPNSWRRAAWAIGPMCAAPIAVMLYQRFIAACPGYLACVNRGWNGELRDRAGNDYGVGGSLRARGRAFDRIAPPHRVRRQAVGAVSAQTQTRFRGDGRSLSRRAPTDEAAVRGEDHSARQEPRSTGAGAV